MPKKLMAKPKKVVSKPRKLPSSRATRPKTMPSPAPAPAPAVPKSSPAPPSDPTPVAETRSSGVETSGLTAPGSTQSGFTEGPRNWSETMTGSSTYGSTYTEVVEVLPLSSATECEQEPPPPPTRELPPLPEQPPPVPIYVYDDDEEFLPISDYPSSHFDPDPSTRPPLPGAKWQLSKKDRALWQPVAPVECRLGPPFPKNFFFWSGEPFSHPFVPLDHHETQYPGAVLLNHPCFKPREGEVRGMHGKYYLHFDPEPAFILKKQTKYLKRAMDITMGHIDQFKQDAFDAAEEYREVRKKRAGVDGKVREARDRTMALSREYQSQEKEMEEMDRKVLTKRLPLVEGLWDEKSRLLRRIEEVTHAIEEADEEILQLNCLGCGMDPRDYVQELVALRELTGKKEALLGFLEDENDQLHEVIQTGNDNVVDAILGLHQVNEAIEIMNAVDFQGPVLEGQNVEGVEVDGAPNPNYYSESNLGLQKIN